MKKKTMDGVSVCLQTWVFVGYGTNKTNEISDIIFWEETIEDEDVEEWVLLN